MGRLRVYWRQWCTAARLNRMCAQDESRCLAVYSHIPPSPAHTHTHTHTHARTSLWTWDYLSMGGSRDTHQSDKSYCFILSCGNRSNLLEWSLYTPLVTYKNMNWHTDTHCSTVKWKQQPNVWVWDVILQRSFSTAAESVPDLKSQKKNSKRLICVYF